jgi:uncharacterized membrane protein (Fun14 family)
MNRTSWNEIPSALTRHRIWCGALLTLGVLGIGLPVFLRCLVLVKRHAQFGTADLRGVLSDIGVGILLFVAMWFVRKKSGLAAALLLGLWLLFNLINFVQVQTLNSSISLGYARYVTDGAFLRGSVLAGYWMLIGAVAAMVALGLSAKWWPSYEHLPPRWRWALGLTGAFSLMGSYAIPKAPSELPWRQENALVGNLQLLGRSASARKASRTKVPAQLRADLSGSLRSLPKVARPNVLLVLMESMSGAHLPALARRNQLKPNASAPKLDALAARSLAFSSAFGHQRQTNRGEYSVLCGDYPKLRSETARMSEIALGQTRRRCLPEVLGGLGYTTAYLQAATMPFMLKDKFMKRIGFAEQVGAEGFPSAYASNAWGVDDHTFFEGSLRYLEGVQSAAAPWFVTLLTVGTHHPYLVAPQCRAPGAGFQRAVGCADEALDTFLQELRQRGVLDNTLVIITADESAGFTEGQDLSIQLSQNWVPLVVLEPGRTEAVLADEPVSLSDLGLSILDYLGKPDAAPHFVGRSLFRSYTKARTLYFANTYLHSIWSLAPDGKGARTLTRCDEALDVCQRFRTDPISPFGSATPVGSPTATDLSALRSVVEYSTRRDAGRSASPMKQSLTLTDVTEVVVRPSADGQLVFGGQYLNIEEGTELELNLQFKLTGPSQAQLRPWFSLHGETATVFAPNLPWMASGDSIELHKRWRAPSALRRLEAVLSARLLGNASVTMEISRASLRLVRKAGGSAVSAERVRLWHDTGRMEPRIFTAASGGFGHAGCLAESTLGRLAGDCNEGFLVFGPYAWAPEGARLSSSMRVRSKARRAVVWLEITNAEGSSILATTQRVTLLPGQTVELATKTVATSDLNLLETRLRAAEQKTKATLEVEEARLEVAN